MRKFIFLLSFIFIGLIGTTYGADTVTVGGDMDNHGCKASAGYTWNTTKNQCTRSWEDTGTGMIVGNDRDEHGCIGSAGYEWDPMLSLCIRPADKPAFLVKWAYGSGLTKYNTVDAFGYDTPITREAAAAILARAGEDIFNLRYASYPDICNVAYKDEAQFDPTLKNDIYQACAFDIMRGHDGIFAPTRTLTLAEALAALMRGVDGGKQDESGPMWYIPYVDRAHQLDILSFANFKGFDEPITRGEFIEWVYKGTTYMNTPQPHHDIIGGWKLVSYQLDDMLFSGDATISFGELYYSVHFCNTISASYTSSGSTFFTQNGETSTKMACPDSHLSQMEKGWTLDGATYSFSGSLIKITMKRGGVYTFEDLTPGVEVRDVTPWRNNPIIDPSKISQ